MVSFLTKATLDINVRLGASLFSMLYLIPALKSKTKEIDVPSFTLRSNLLSFRQSLESYVQETHFCDNYPRLSLACQFS